MGLRGIGLLLPLGRTSSTLLSGWPYGRRALPSPRLACQWKNASPKRHTLRHTPAHACTSNGEPEGERTLVQAEQSRSSKEQAAVSVASVDARFMKEALREAQLAFDIDEVPIGAVLVQDGQVIARAHNR